MKITEAFAKLQRHGHVEDQYSFDDRWLGKRPGYFAYLKSTSSQPSVETLMRFHFRLAEADNKFSIYGLNTGELNELAMSMMDEVKVRCA
jgi:hypothetical protein